MGSFFTFLFPSFPSFYAAYRIDIGVGRRKPPPYTHSTLPAMLPPLFSLRARALYAARCTHYAYTHAARARRSHTRTLRAPPLYLVRTITWALANNKAAGQEGSFTRTHHACAHALHHTRTHTRTRTHGAIAHHTRPTPPPRPPHLNHLSDGWTDGRSAHATGPLP